MQINRRTIRRSRNFLLLLVFLAVCAGALAHAVNWWHYSRFWVVTDNAFVTGNLIPVYADATGMVTQVLYEETEEEKVADILIRLDEQRARAALGEAEGELGRAVREVGAFFATRLQLCQRILSRSALFDKARHDIVRYREALPSGSVSKQVLQNAEDQLASLEADLKEARAEFLSIEARVGGTTRLNHPEINSAESKFIEADIEFARQLWARRAARWAVR